MFIFEVIVSGGVVLDWIIQRDVLIVLTLQVISVNNVAFSLSQQKLPAHSGCAVGNIFLQ